MDPNSFLDRLIDVLSRHKTFDADCDTNPENIIHFINKCGDLYPLKRTTESILIQIMNDFDAYLIQQKKANEMDNFTERIYHKLCNKSKRCNATTCKSIQRNGLRQCKTNTDTKPEDVYQNSIDTMHIELYHAMEMGYRLSQSEKDEIKAAHDADEKMKAKRKQFRNATKTNDEKSNKFVSEMPTNNTTLLKRERLIVHLRSRGMDRETLIDFHNALVEMEFDTDSIEYDAEIGENAMKSNSKLECNLHNILLRSNETHFRKVTRCLFESEAHTKGYSNGIRFYYWPFYKDTTEDRPVIFTNTESILQQHWTDPGNAGYKPRDWYIEAKYEDMRDEILNNPIYSLSKKQWDSLQRSAKMKIEGDFCRGLADEVNTYLVEPYGVKEMELKHVVAMLLYTNYTDLCTAFASTLRRDGMFETDEEWKARHVNYWYMAKYLREMVEVFGIDRFDMCDSYRQLHHGVSAPLYLKSMYTTFCGTMSTSTNWSVANSFATDDGHNGVVLTLFTPRTGTLLVGFECFRISDYPHEDEILFYGGFSKVQIGCIRKCVKGIWKNYTHYCDAIQGLDRMVSGDPNSKQFEFSKVLEDMMRWQTNVDVDSDIDEYVLGLFVNFCQHKLFVKVNWLYMCRDLIIKDAFTKTKAWGYKSIRHLFVEPRLSILDFGVIQTMFPSLQEIVIKNWFEVISYTKEKNEAEDKEKSDEKDKENEDEKDKEEEEDEVDKEGKKEAMPGGKMMNDLLQMIWNAFESGAASKLRKVIIAFPFPMRMSNKRCLKSHRLRPGLTESDGSIMKYSCARCSERMGQEEVECFYGCGWYAPGTNSECDYTVCTTCYHQQNDFFIHLQDAINKKYQELFNQMSWKITKGEHIKTTRDKVDAIVFEKVIIKQREEEKAEKVVLVNPQEKEEEDDEPLEEWVSGEDRLRHFFNAIGFDTHCKTLIEAGCDTLDTLNDLDDVDTLVEVGIPREDAQTIVNALQNQYGNNEVKEEEPQQEVNDEPKEAPQEQAKDEIEDID